MCEHFSSFRQSERNESPVKWYTVQNSQNVVQCAFVTPTWPIRSWNKWPVWTDAKMILMLWYLSKLQQICGDSATSRIHGPLNDVPTLAVLVGLWSSLIRKMRSRWHWNEWRWFDSDHEYAHTQGAGTLKIFFSPILTTPSSLKRLPPVRCHSSPSTCIHTREQIGV
jgi:hypothetical protein